MVRRRSRARSLPEQLLSIVNFRGIRLTSVSLGVAIGIGIGGHFFEAPPPPIYQSPDGTQIRTCFTPANQCLPLILTEIKSAKKEILVQAYYLSSKTIANRLIEAKRRGVLVRVLLDKTQDSGSNDVIKMLKYAGIDVRIDSKPAIAHNKIILIDGRTVIGGSYNYSEAAERSNAENITMIKNNKVIKNYRENWLSRYKVARLPKQ